MAGHSKWNNIKRRKSAQDSKRGKIFTRLLREVTVAAREGGGDPTGNPRLRSAIQECKANNMPNDNLERAIKKGTGEIEGVSYDEVTYEGYGPGGVALIVETMTDNRNRTVSEVRHLFSKHGGNLGENGCVSYMFNKRGYFVVEPETMDEEEFMELAMDLEVDDFATDSGAYEMFTDPSAYSDTREALNQRSIEVALAQQALIPSTMAELTPDQVPKATRLVEALEELDDVQNVWSNFELDEESEGADAD